MDLIEQTADWVCGPLYMSMPSAFGYHNVINREALVEQLYKHYRTVSAQQGWLKDGVAYSLMWRGVSSGFPAYYSTMWTEFMQIDGIGRRWAGDFAHCIEHITFGGRLPYETILSDPHLLLGHLKLAADPGDRTPSNRAINSLRAWWSEQETNQQWWDQRMAEQGRS